MCIIYTDHRTRTSKILIHIPRTGGKAWRRSLKADPLVSIHRELWGVSSGKDQAHIPAMHISKYVENVESYETHAVLRDPYQRLLSAFNMKFARFGAKPADFKHFVKNVLPAMKLDGQTNAAIIHFVPQVHFVTGTNLDINLHQFDTTYDKVLTSWYDFEAAATVDRIHRKDFDFIAGAFNVVYSQAISDGPNLGPQWLHASFYKHFARPYRLGGNTPNDNFKMFLRMVTRRGTMEAMPNVQQKQSQADRNAQLPESSNID